MTADLVIYEYPTTELTRACLRLEHLFNLIDQYLTNTHSHASRDTMRTLIDILNVLDRPDLKSKFTQEFHRLIKVFDQLQGQPSISQETLQETLTELKRLLQYFVDTKGKFAQRLRDTFFIANLRSHLTTAGGDCAFELPSFHYWLQQPLDKQQRFILEWLKELDNIRQAVALTLKIIRHSAEPHRVSAEDGYYHDVLSAPCQLIRIGLAGSHLVFPKVSAGKHRINVRFLHPTRHERPVQSDKHISFSLTLCAV